MAKRNIREAGSRDSRKAVVAAARELRQRQTPSELLLWEALRNRRLLGRKFRRQARIGHVIVDFYCPEEGLIVEVDGGVHRRQRTADRERQEALEAMDLRVLRVDADACHENLEAVLENIRSTFRADARDIPSPSMRERGQG